MKQKRMLKVGIIGLGAIGRNVANHIDNGNEKGAVLVSLLCRDKEKHIALSNDQTSHFKSIITDNSDVFFDTKPDIVIEAAGQDTLKLYGLEVLRRGIDLLVSSIGLFTNDDILLQFTKVTEQSGAKILLSAGALPGIDWMSAASFSKVNHISIIQTKPVESWTNTAAEKFIDLYQIKTPTCFFEGTAREAANIFPKSSNITAMLALATIGMDNIKVKLIADPINPIMNTSIHFDSAVGELEINLKGVPSIENPSTSAEVPLSMIKTIRNISSTISYGV